MARRLDGVYAATFIDAIMVKVRYGDTEAAGLCRDGITAGDKTPGPVVPDQAVRAQVLDERAHRMHNRGIKDGSAVWTG